MARATDSTKIFLNKYVEVEGKMDDETSIWHYFLRSEDKKLAKCKNSMCQAIVKAAGGSTSGCQTHLRTKHNIDLKKLKEKSKPQTEGIIEHKLNAFKYTPNILYLRN